MMRLRFLNWVVRVWLCDEIGYLCPDCRRNKMIAHRQALHVMRGSPGQDDLDYDYIAKGFNDSTHLR